MALECFHMYTHTCIDILYTHKVHVCSNNNHIVQQFTANNRVVSPRLGAGLLPRSVAVDPTSRTPAVKDGAKTISGTHEQFISEETKPYKHTRQI